MTPEQEQTLLENVAVVRSDVKTIKEQMVTHDRCKATREEWRRRMANGVLSTWRERAWRLVTIVIAVAATGFVTWLVAGAGR